MLLLLLGLYSQECLDGFRRSQEFDSSRVVYSEENFFDPACGEPSVVSRSYGEYATGAESNGHQEINFVFRKVSLEPKTEAIAAGYRARALCGVRDWLAGHETDITGRLCDFLNNGGNFAVPADGDARFGILKKEGDSLWFGRLSPGLDGSSPDRRPRVLDPLPYRLKLR